MKRELKTMIFDGLMMLLLSTIWIIFYYYTVKGMTKIGKLIKRMVRNARYKME